MASIPYQDADSGSARDEVTKILRKFGCESVGFMDDYETHSVLLAFQHRGRAVQLRASAKGWANMWLKQNPYSSRRRCSQTEWNQRALVQGQKAVNSILRDWIKGQVTAVETGVLSFEGVFLPYMLTNDGSPLIERLEATGLLPPPTKAA